MKPVMDIAICGVGAIFPDAPDATTFWNNIVSGISAARDVSPDRWSIAPSDAFADTGEPAPDKVYSKRACLIDFEPEVDLHDLDISEELYRKLDPSVRLVLAAGIAAARDTRISLKREGCGVILGNLALPTEHSSAIAREILGKTFEEKVLGHATRRPPDDILPLSRYVTGLPAGVLAKALGLDGGALTLDAACASSLYAIKRAIEELADGRLDAVLAGGMSRPDSLYTQMGFSQLRALSPTGVCSPFDANGNGLVVGEGACVFVLKRLRDAEADGDTIRGVIRGVGLSNDVDGSLLAPSSEGQLRAMRDAYRRSGWSPADVDLIECHATGTPLGDAVEVNSLRDLWDGEDWRPGQCVIGSVKSNVGHTLTAAGSAALLKVLLAIEHETLPPTANFHAPAPNVDLDGSPFAVLTKPRAWSRRDEATPRRAAVSAFGFGGINAHVLVEEYRESDHASRDAAPLEISDRPEAVAIVGMDVRVGPWDSLRAFQERVLGGGEKHEPKLPSHWWGAEHSAWFRRVGLDADCFRGHYLDAVSVPLTRFRIPPRELEEMLPQQLYMLDCAAAALENAGIKHRSEEASDAAMRSGVFVGIGLDLNTTNFSFRWSLQNAAREWPAKLGLNLDDAEESAWLEALRDAAGPALNANRTMGALGSIVASRIAREFAFGGTSYTISSEESSGVRALETALRALQSGDLDRALVGAVDLAGDVRAVIETHADRPFAADGIARPFDANATGTVPADGTVALVLKRLTDAQRDGDRIYSVIRGIGVASGGAVDRRVPDEPAYVRAVDRALADAGVSADSIDYVETHGSGNPDEDQMEIRALKKTFPRDTDSSVEEHLRHYCVIGSAKSDLGHTGAAAGLVGIAKAALCLYNEMLPPLRALSNRRNELTDLEHRLIAPTESQYWLRDRAQGPRRAGVSSFSIDGNCAHVILEGFEQEHDHTVYAERLQPLGARDEGLFTVEANNADALAVGLSRLQSFAESHTNFQIEKLARTWWKENREDPAKQRCMSFVARSTDELLRQIEFGLQCLSERPDQRIIGKEAGLAPPYARDRVFYSPEGLATEGEIAYVYPGSGNQYRDMGRDLARQWPEVLRRQDAENRYLFSQYQPDIFWNSNDTALIQENHQAALFGQVAMGTAATDLVRSFGIRADAVIGYSLGETAGLFSTRAWTDRDAMLERINASTLFTQDLAGEYRAARKAWELPNNKTVDWALGVIDRPAKVVRAALQDHKKVYTLIVNTLQECVVGGDPHAVEKLVKKLDCEFFPLHGVTTVHCEVAKEVQEPYRELHVQETRAPKRIRYYSGAWGTAYNVTSETAADSVLAQAIYGIDYPRVIEAAYADGARLFIEMGPGASCSRMIGEILGDRPHVARSVGFQSQSATTSVLRGLAQLAAERVAVDLSVLYGQETFVLDHQDTLEPVPTVNVTVGGSAFEPVAPPQPAVAVRTPVPGPVSPIPSNPDTLFVPSAPDVAEIAEFANGPEAPLTHVLSEGTPEPIVAEWQTLELAKADAHDAYLRATAATEQALATAIEMQIRVLSGAKISTSAAPMPVAPRPFVRPQRTKLAMDREACLEYARGSIARSMGQEYAAIDAHPTRVRLPDEPLMLVDRIVEFDGEALSLTHGRVVTEHDVLPGAWYLDCDRAPVCISVEAGQADLILAAYLGIDFKTGGLAMYRLLDAVITFHRGLPRPGETLHYDIRIEQFFRQGDTHLMRFNFDATIDGQAFITMRDGCAGYFTREELDAGAGVVRTTLDNAPKPGKRPANWTELVPMQRESYSDAQISALRSGDLGACFGEAFGDVQLANPAGLPGGRMKLVDRILDLDPRGGRYGLGVIRGEMDVKPDDWFLTCHFVDDMVMPGTLMYECCLHTLRVFLLRMGWISEAAETAYEPVAGVSGRLKCRGEVNETTDKVVYEVEIKELGYNPAPYAIADCLMYVDGKPSIEMQDMSVQLTGVTFEALERVWRQSAGAKANAQGTILYDNASIMAYAEGNPSNAFGEPYRVFDRDRFIARLPRPPYKFLDRIVAADCDPWVMRAGGTIEAEYDVPADAWYFGSARREDMPFAILLEAALQPCGWFSAYMGSPLTSDKDLHYRNLGGTATQHIAVLPDVGTLRTRVRCTGVSSSGGMIIQNFRFDVFAKGQLVYEGDTNFGYFTKEALANQIGIRGAELHEPSREECSVNPEFAYPREAPYPDDQWRMIDRVEVFDPKGGPDGKGFIRAYIDVDPGAWFFKAHFYQDPVWPGSLGLEAMLQLMQHVATERWAIGPQPQIESIGLGHEHKWIYRGQVIPGDSRVYVEACVREVDDDSRLVTADGHLCVDGRVIYEMQGFTVRVSAP